MLHFQSLKTNPSTQASKDTHHYFNQYLANVWLAQ